MLPNSKAQNNNLDQDPKNLANISSVEKSVEHLTALLRDLQQDAQQATKISAARAYRDVSVMLRSYALTDSMALTLGFICAWSLAVIVNTIFFDRALPNGVTDFVRIAQYFLIGGAVIVWFEHTSHYNVRLPFWIEIKKVVEAMCCAMLVDGFLQFASKNDFSRLWLMAGWAFAGVSIIVLRSLWRHVLRQRGEWSLPTLLVGSGQGAQDVRLALASEPGLGYDIVAQIEDVSAAFESSGRSWKALCGRHKAEYVMLALGSYDVAKGEQAVSQLMRENVPFTISPSLYKAPVFGMEPQYFFNHDVMLMTHNHGLDRPLPCFTKRAFDIFVSASALLLLSPVLLVLALLVKMDGGSALYGHKRLGFNGKSFPCLKFRSMIVNSDEVLKKHLADNAEARAEWQRDFKLRNDPRVTAVGKFLRKTSLDELPQLLNVLRGDMSIVGPRPIIVAETEKYQNDISHYYRVRPGVTGLWQVSGRNDVSYADRVHMDTWYVRNWSLWHDIAIIFKTIPVVLKRGGAY